MTVVIELSWPVWAEGLEWVDGQKTDTKGRVGGGRVSSTVSGQQLRPIGDGHNPPAFRTNRPLDEFPTLFIEFGSLDRTPDSFLGFANRYGRLGTESATSPIPSRIPGDEGACKPASAGPAVDSTEYWAQAVDRMKWALGIWEALHNGEMLKAQQLLQKGPSTPDSKSNRPRRGPGILGSMATMQGAVTGAIQTQLGNHEVMVRQSLDEIIADSLANNVDVCTRGGGATDPTELVLKPRTLLAGLWLQFALAVVEKLRSRACRTCGRMFLLTLGDDGRQARRLFCSDACKTRDYRERKTRALELRKEGLSVEKVAQAVGTDVDTVRSWFK